MPGQEVEQCRLFIQKLQIHDQRPQALNDIKNLLTLKYDETINTIKDVGLSNIFHCLNVEDKYVILFSINFTSKYVDD